MKVSELFEVKREFINTILDREISKMSKDPYKSIPALKKMGLHSNPGDEAFGREMSKPKGLDADARKKRVMTRGYRSGFAGDRMDGGEGLSNDDMKSYVAAEKAGMADRKKHKDEIPKSWTANRYGERKNNKDFEKIMKPYLDAFVGGIKEDLNEGISLDSLKGLTKAQVTKLMKANDMSPMKIPGGMSKDEAAYRGGQGYWYVTFIDGKASRAKLSR